MEIARDWRLQRERYLLIGEICNHCSAKIFPKRAVCPNCSGECFKEFNFSGKGEIFSFTILHEAPEGYTQNLPFAIALIKLTEGPLVTAQLTDIDNQKISIGMKVEMVTRKLKEDGDKGKIVYGYKFRPILSLSSK